MKMRKSGAMLFGWALLGLTLGSGVLIINTPFITPLTVQPVTGSQNVPVSHYQLEKDVLDNVGINHGSTPNGDLSYTAGVIGQAGMFDGTDDYVVTRINLAEKIIM